MKIILLAICVALTAANKSGKTPVKRQAGCEAGEFECKNGNCIQSEWTCDTDNDCGDHSDEQLPECPPHGSCTGEHEINCGSHECISIEFRCDGTADCADGTDERNCHDFQCVGGEFKCDNGHCVEADWICDGDNDCVDNSDERESNCHLKPTHASG